jgi:hypothetical protein
MAHCCDCGLIASITDAGTRGFPQSVVKPDDRETASRPPMTTRSALWTEPPRARNGARNGGLARRRLFSRFPVFRAEFQNREVPSVGCLNNTANIPIKKAIQIYPSNASDAATNRASIEGRTSP